LSRSLLFEENCFAKIEQVSRQLKLGKHTIKRHLKNIRIKSFIEFLRPFIYRAFYEFGLYRKYPVHYWKFNSLIYPLFNMDKPKDYEEKLQMQWPDKKILRTRYRELLKIHHPDRYHQSPQTARAAHFKFRWIVKAYSHLLKRHKKLTISEPPPAIKQMSVHPINNGKVISP